MAVVARSSSWYHATRQGASRARWFSFFRATAARKGDDDGINCRTHASSSSSRNANDQSRSQAELLQSPERPALANYAEAVTACNKAGQWADTRATSLGDHMKITSEVIRTLGEAKHWEQALAMLHATNQTVPTIEAYNAVLTACMTHGKWRNAIDIFTSVEQRRYQSDLKPTELTYKLALRACDKGAQWELALQILATMQSRGMGAKDPSLVISALNACAKCGEWTRALRLLDDLEVRGLQSAFAYNCAIHACVNQWEIACGVLDRMRNAQVRPDVVSYNVAISACGNAAKWEHALRLVTDMRLQRVVPDVITYSASISACDKGKQWACAVRILRAMEADGVRADAIAYSAAISACETAGQHRVGMNLYREASERHKLFQHWREEDSTKLQVDFHDFRLAEAKAALRVIMNDFATGRGRAATANLTLIVGRGAHSVGHGPVLKTAILEMLTSEFSPPLHIVKDYDAGIIRISLTSIKEWMRRNGAAARPKAPRDLATGSGVAAPAARASRSSSSSRRTRTSDDADAWRVALAELDARVQRGQVLNAFDYSKVMSQCARAREWVTAISLLDTMRHRAVAPNVVVFNAAIGACAKAEQWSRALGVMRAMHEGNVCPDVRTFSAAISACEKGGRWVQALALLHQMKIDDVAGDVILYNVVISACAKGAQWDRALQLLTRMKEENLEPDVISFSAAISACEKGAQWERALAVLHHMLEHNIDPNVISYSAAISALEKGAQWELALSLLEYMSDQGLKPNVVSYSATISACEKGDQWELALSLLDRMRTQHRLTPNTISYNAAISACAKGSPSHALALFHHMTSTLKLPPTVYTYTAAINACDPIGDWARALTLFHDMQKRGITPDAFAYTAAIASCDSAQQYDAAVTLYREACALNYFNHWCARDHNMIDFHHYRIASAKTALRVIVEDYMRADAAPTSDLVLIVGQGYHSDGGVNVLRPVLLHMLEHDFLPPLESGVMANNAGRIIVSHTSLQRWMKAQKR
eukprot:GEMP01002953.1.p1 GENE.GEMP01002953.1~~GEMP01002953.1.p1  ORF type:complete len:999 (-),score=289.81 GEMP01002953.1:1454-4450(-)